MILWINATFYTLDEQGNIFNQIVTDQGKILALGEIASTYPYKQVIDLKGSYVYPGFIDSHAHVLGYGLKSAYGTLEGLKTKETVLKKIKNEKHKKFQYYYPVGIHKKDLDFISKDEMIMLRHDDFHTFTMNSRALSYYNIESETGIVADHVASLHDWTHFSKDDYIKMLEKSIQSFYQFGITGIHTEELSYYGDYHKTVQVFDNVLSRFKMHIHMLIHHDVYNHYQHDMEKHQFSFGAVKLFYDGTLSSKTALIKQNYKNEDHNGGIQSKVSFEEKVRYFRSKGEALAIHVIGDQGLNDVLDILLKYPSNSVLKDRIIHASLANEETFERLKNRHVHFDIQPQFIVSDMPFFTKTIDHQTMLLPLLSYQKHHVNMMFGSDAPVELPDPLMGIYHACNHGSESIKRLDAIKNYTQANHLLFDGKSGLMKEGYIANFTAFDHDIMTCNLELLKETQVTYTIIEEDIVYQK